MGMDSKVLMTISSFIIIFCFFTLGQFILFLSSHNSLMPPYKWNREGLKNDVHQGSVLMSLFCNFILLGIFVLQHTLQAKMEVKTFLYHKGFDVIERMLYNCGSCFALQVVMYFWQPIPSVTIWEVSTSDHTVLWWLFSTIHFIAWLTVYSGCCIMDLTELVGLKQVYHHMLKWPPPLYKKSEDLRRFYAHMRHPGFSGLIAVLLIHPVMYVDRLLLAYTFVIYMIAKFKVDDIDYTYQKSMLHRKCRDLSN